MRLHAVYVRFEMFIRYLNGDIKLVVSYMSLKFGVVFWFGGLSAPAKRWHLKS